MTRIQKCGHVGGRSDDAELLQLAHEEVFDSSLLWMSDNNHLIRDIINEIIRFEILI